MKRKVGTLIEENVFRLAKRRAVEEARSLSDLIQEALIAYLNKKITDPKKREEAYRLFCEQPMPLSREQFDLIQKEDTWEQ
jgi:hypothetical protein